MSDLISRQDAIEVARKYLLDNYITDDDWHADGIEREIKALPSSEVKPTVIRSRTLLPTKDFKEWAKRVREENPNVIVIPCDAEDVSAEAEWIPREYFDVLKKNHDMLAGLLEEAKARAIGAWIPVSERLPEDKTYVLTTIQVNGRQPHARSGFYHGGFFHNDNGDTWEATDREVKAWMPLHEPYKGGEEE